MKQLPLSDLLSKVSTSEMSVVTKSTGSVGMAEVQLIQPNVLNETVELKYIGLSYSQLSAVEASFKASRGVERFIYKDARYILKDGYSVVLRNSSADVTFSLQQVG